MKFPGLLRQSAFVGVLSLLFSGFALAQVGIQRKVVGTTAGEQFGRGSTALADIDGDGVNDYAAAAPFASGNGPGSGRVVVYSGLSGKVIYQLLGGAPGDEFGRSMAGSHDVDGDGIADLLVGARAEDGTAGTDCGAAHLFSGASGSPIFSLQGNDPGDLFGTRVVFIDDVTGDGIADILIGARLGDDLPGTSSDTGTVTLFSGANGNFIHRSAGWALNDWYGHDVVAIGDWDGDMDEDYAVGIPLSDFGQANAGRVEIRDGASGALITAFNGSAAGDELGYSIDAALDVDGDGKRDLLMGSHRNDTAANDAGRVELRKGGSGALLFQAHGDAGGDQLGRSVAIVGDMNGDGSIECAAGAPKGNGAAGINAGYVRIYSGATGLALGTVAGEQVGGELGWQMSRGSGDLTGDGRADIIANARLLDGLAGVDIGGAYLISVADAAYEGSGEDYRLLCGVNGLATDFAVKSMPADSFLTVRVESPQGGYVGTVPMILASFITTGGPIPTEAGYPETHFALSNVSVVLDGYTAGYLPAIVPAWGLELNFYYPPPGVTGISLLFQSACFVPSVATGHFFTTSNAVEIRLS